MKAMHLRRGKRARGFSLAEFMVAVTIGLVIIGGVGSIYVSSKQTYRSNDNLSRVQENIRIAFDVMTHDIRQASYMGCAGQDATFYNDLNNSSDLLWNFSVPISGYTATGTDTWNASFDTTVITNPLGGVGRDILLIRSVGEGGGPVITNASSTDTLAVSANSGISTGDTLMASNCSITTVFQATAVTTGSTQDVVAHTTSGGTPGNSTEDLSGTFANGELRRISTKIYYIGTGASGIPALFVRDSSETAAQEVVEGIDGMEVEYGIDDNDDYAADRYVTASAAQSGSLWSKVISVKLSLTAISPEDNVAVTAQSNTTGTETNRRLRQQMTTIISLRNRTG